MMRAKSSAVTPHVEIEVVAARGSMVVKAMLDTGFYGDLCLPTDIAVSLGLELAARQWVEFADGRKERELVFTGQVRFLGELRPVEIVLIDSSEALVGMGLLAGCTLFIDFETGEIRVEKKKPVKGPHRAAR